ncbi:sulfite exporter TauE/SafE family protein [Chlorobium sp. N1]|uniref:sulfite exporter TauE/SafE family protein n=1 Tax=Chlorobium sp. N1 TaxID=2491138 RepID=UPI00103ABF63|nr:sulfite exporter TauE/SafE family protein [Chlorobium sp. N1]TCD48224.1 sulfite exporter TauE/SafE family protein [Chlorobium sp. N1]
MLPPSRKSLAAAFAPACLALLLFLVPSTLFAAGPQAAFEAAWYVWVLLLFVFSFVLGIFAVLAGVGGGVLFVPIVSSFFPFHLDYVRGAGLMVALSGAISAGAPLMRKGLADLKLGLPMALIGSMSSIAGAMVGLALPAQTVQLLLGIVIVAIAVIMLLSGKSGYPVVKVPDALSKALHISGIYYEESIGKEISWQVHRTPLSFVFFLMIGFIGGMFGLGAGFANVPVFNLLMGVPLKVSVATSGLVLSINGAAAAWVYMFKGAMLPLIAVPSIGGMMLGSKIGARLLSRVNTGSVRVIVVSMLAVAGFRSLLKGFGI